MLDFSSIILCMQNDVLNNFYTFQYNQNDALYFKELLICLDNTVKRKSMKITQQNQNRPKISYLHYFFVF